jgi:hypothetical protein
LFPGESSSTFSIWSSSVLIEQAIFTSAKTSRGAGYQLVARSPGVRDDDARELAVWGPSHDALCEDREENSSVNFHRLSSGKFAVSKTSAAGQEYSGRGGARIYTQYFLVPMEVLAKFSNNPFAILRAVWAKGLLAVHNDIPQKLESFSLVGRATAVDEGLLGQLADQWGAKNVGQLVSASMTARPKILAGAKNMETLVGGLLNYFPTECRTEISFTTGLRYSLRRPFRLAPADDDLAGLRRSARQGEIELLDLANAPAEPPLHGWAKFVAETIASDQLPLLTAQLQIARPGLRIENLDLLGEELLNELHATAVAAPQAVEQEVFAERRETSSTRQFRRDTPIFKSQDASDARNEPADSTRRVGRRKTDRAAYASRPKFHAIDHPEVIELFEQLDDAVYDAISGAPQAESKVIGLWQKIAGNLTSDQLASTREQYLRYTLTLWDACVNEGVREADKAVRALDVLTVLFSG